MRQVGGGFNRRIFAPIPVSSTGPSLAFPHRGERDFWIAGSVAHRGRVARMCEECKMGLVGPGVGYRILLHGR